VKCDRCSAREATVRLTHVVEGEARTQELCEQCAAEQGITVPGATAQTPLGGFLSALWKGAEQEALGLATGGCPGCGATFADFRESGRLGCAECWRAFEPALRILIRRYHGSTHHLGRRHLTQGASQGLGRVDAVHDLRERLRQAVDVEDFELAARLRDQLKEVS
jgi:protein arginine kinase activator